MKQVEFFEEPGRILDLVVLFVSHFNREFFQKDPVVDGGLSKLAELCSRLPEIPEELRIFFHTSEYKKSPTLCGFSGKEKKTCVFGRYTPDSFGDLPKDCEYAKRRILRCYFPELGDAEVAECMNSVAAVSRVIRASAYEDSIKSGLYAFFIEPEAILHRFAEELTAKDAALRAEYAREAKRLAELRAGFDLEWVIRSIFPKERAEELLAQDKPIYVTFMLFQANERVYRDYEDECSLCLGCGYREHLEARNRIRNTPKLENFGQAVSDPNRIAILELIRERGVVTVRDVEQVVGLSGTNVYYHLTLLQKEGMLRRKSRGRAAAFSLDTEYFKGLCKELETFTKRPEPQKDAT